MHTVGAAYARQPCLPLGTGLSTGATNHGGDGCGAAAAACVPGAPVVGGVSPCLLMDSAVGQTEAAAGKGGGRGKGESATAATAAFFAADRLRLAKEASAATTPAPTPTLSSPASRSTANGGWPAPGHERQRHLGRRGGGRLLGVRRGPTTSSANGRGQSSRRDLPTADSVRSRQGRAQGGEPSRTTAAAAQQGPPHRSTKPTQATTAARPAPSRATSRPSTDARAGAWRSVAERTGDLTTPTCTCNSASHCHFRAMGEPGPHRRAAPSPPPSHPHAAATTHAS